MFSGFYLPLFLLLVGLIIRGISFEYDSKDANPGAGAGRLVSSPVEFAESNLKEPEG